MGAIQGAVKVFSLLDLCWEYLHKRLYEVVDILWKLIGGDITAGAIGESGLFGLWSLGRPYNSGVRAGFGGSDDVWFFRLFDGCFEDNQG